MPATWTIMPRAPLASTASVTTSPTDTRARAASCRDSSTPGVCALDGESAALAAAGPRKSAMSVARGARPITAGLWHGVRRRVRPYNSRSLVTDRGRNELTDRARDAARRRSAAIGGSPGERQRVAFGSPTADEARLPTCFAREIDATAESRLENRARDVAPCHPPPARFLRELTIERRRHPNRQHGRFILRTSHPVYSIQTPDAGRRLRTHRGLRAHRRRTDGAGTPRCEWRGGIPVAACGGDAVAVMSWEAGTPVWADHEVHAQFEIRDGSRAMLALTSAYAEPLVFPQREALAARLDGTVRFWQQWIDARRYQGPWRDAVARSALVLKALIFSPSGASVAAPTTSLPEEIGGERNWDYRFCWLRDSNFMIDALLELGGYDEARSSFWWFMHDTALTEPDLHVLYRLDGAIGIARRDIPLDGHLPS